MIGFCLYFIYLFFKYVNVEEQNSLSTASPLSSLDLSSV